MKIKKNILGGLLIVFSLVEASSVDATPLQDFYIQQAIGRYYSLPQDARSLSMAGSSRLQCADSSCIYNNPAGLSQMEKLEATFTFGSGRSTGRDFLSDSDIEDVEHRGYGTLAIPLGSPAEGHPNYGTLALAFSRYQGDEIDSLNTIPDGHRRTLGYGLPLSESLSLGYSFTFYDDQLHNELSDLHSHARILHLVGAQFSLDKDSRFGVLFGLGTGQSDTEDYILRSDGLSHPRQISAALGYSTRFEAWNHSFGFDYSHYRSTGNLMQVSQGVVVGGNENGDMLNFRVGTEYAVWNNFLLRAGFRWLYVPEYEFERENVEELSGGIRGLCWSAGLGYYFGDRPMDSPRIDYGVELSNVGHGSSEHLLTLSLPFNIGS